MNKLEYEQLKLRGIRLLETNSHRPVPNVIRWGTNETWEHYLLKCNVARALYEGVPTHAISELVEANEGLFFYDSTIMGWKKGTKMLKYKMKSWERPMIITEAVFKIGTRADIFLISPFDKLCAIEIAKSERKKSLKIKEKRYGEIDVDFVSLSC